MARPSPFLASAHASTASPSSAPVLDWTFTQSFGDDNSSEDDLVTAVAFDRTGDYLAVGDKAGRICIFEGQAMQTTSSRHKGMPEYHFFSEFQSHEAEFDCLKSLEIEERINMVEWCHPRSNGLFLLATNDKTIKLWKVYKKTIYAPPPIAMSYNELKLEVPDVEEEAIVASRKRVYANAHQYHVNSVSLNSDQDHFLSADDLRIHLWNAEISSESFNIVDHKPNNLEDLTEVITCARFHPTFCNYMLYGTSRGNVNVCDLRDSALCDQHSKVFKVQEDASQTSFFSEILSCISDARFTTDGRFMVCRDTFSVKVWDLRSERRPVYTLPVHDYLRTQVADLYENDCIFDAFTVDCNADASQVVTGSYGNMFFVLNTTTGLTHTVECDQPEATARRHKTKKKAKKKAAPDVNKLNFTKKMLHVGWHPTANVAAVAGGNKLYVYQGLPPLEPP